VAFVCACCGGEKTEYVNKPMDNELTPNIAVDSVTELISDSGVIRYRLLAETWLFFDKANEKRWFFPKGLYVEQFDSTFHVSVTLKADTAWNFYQRKLWKLKGHVFVRNIHNETFESEELYWDERTGKVYSNVDIKINRPDKLTIRGLGFESNQQMTEYRIFHPYDSDIYVKESEDGMN
jgi:LPS export ABC transporter protein LptC